MHRRIYFLHAADVSGANERVRAFRDVLVENGILFHEGFVSKALTNAEEGYEETKRLLREWEGFSAVIAGNDFIATERLLVMIRDPEERTKPRKIVKTPTLVVRESCRRVG